MPDITMAIFQGTENQVFTVNYSGSDYQSVFPAPLSEFNKTHETSFDAWAWIVEKRSEDVKYCWWQILESTKAARCLWKGLADIPTDPDGSDGCIEEDFLHFVAGSEVLEIWHWFEFTFDLQLEELMFQKP